MLCPRSRFLVRACWCLTLQCIVSSVLRFLQITVQPDQYVIRDTTPEAFAERMWKQTSTFPMSPLRLALSPEQIESVHGEYLREVARQGQAMQVGSDIVNVYTEMIVVATA